MKKHVGILFSLFLGVSEFLYSQHSAVSNVHTTISGDHKLFIHYNLESNDSSQNYNIELKFTYEGQPFIPDPGNLYGDFGNHISSGDKIVFWDFGNEPARDINKVKVDVYLQSEEAFQANIEVLSIGNNGYAPSTVSFQNKTANADNCFWDFGDPESGPSNNSTVFNPKHTYGKAGIYSVTLKARNNATNQESTFYQTIELKSHTSPKANFQFNEKNLKAPVTILFSNLSVNANSYYWKFGDPASKKKNSSMEKNPKHKYARGGKYFVELIAVKNYGGQTDTIIKEVEIQQADGPVAEFSYSSSSDKAPTVVNFENTSRFVSKYKWNFGDTLSADLNKSKGASPVHLYENPGRYIVQLNARSKWYKKSTVFTDTIKVYGPSLPPKAGFIVENNNAYAPCTIIFKNNSTDANEYSWNFGDPQSERKNTSAEMNPTHTYFKPGKYKVVLVVGGQNNKDKDIFTAIVNILSIPE